MTNAQVDKHSITFYTTYINVDLAHYEIFRAYVGKGGIKLHGYILTSRSLVVLPKIEKDSHLTMLLMHPLKAYMNVKIKWYCNSCVSLT